MNYGKFGGQYVPLELKKKLKKIQTNFEKIKNDIIVVCLSGRGDKDLDTILKFEGGEQK